jgi:hypothetical protein
MGFKKRLDRPCDAGEGRFVGWDTVVRGIHNVQASGQGRAEQAVQIAELIRQAGSYRWVGLYAVPTKRPLPLAGAGPGRLPTRAFR